MEKDVEYFINKEDQIRRAIAKVTLQLSRFSVYAEYINSQCEANNRLWTEEEKIPVRKWNDWHDLKDRLESRLKENAVAYHSMAYRKLGFSVISIK